MVGEAVAVYRNRWKHTDCWRGYPRGRIEKLDSLKIRVAYPDDGSLYDYSDLDFPEEAGLIEDVLAIRDKNRAQNVEKAKAEIDSDMWMTAPQTVNAYYLMTDNSINIPAGILGGDFYDPEGTDAEQMGSIGVVIGHEITHGFDTSGSQYDKDGNLNNWWTDEDHAAFEERTDKVSAYFSKLEVLPDVYVDGDLTIGETVADLGGLSCMLEIAKGTEGFDYEDFFTSFARVWKNQTLPNVLEMLVQTDSHPPGYIRTNATVQQVQEFYDTFGVGEGDGMYLAPDERLSVW
jgi:putative endopeptidase